MKISERGADLIKESEGFRSCPYKRRGDVWTIGYGSTKGVGPNTKCITRQQAEQRMRREVNDVYGKAVNDLNLPLNQNQFDALVSFVYNLGTGAIKPSTGIGRQLRAKNWKRAADEMLRWNKGGVPLKPMEGLTNRRKAERALFLRRKEEVMASNGRLPSSMLRAIPGGRLEKSVANSWLRLRERIGREKGVWICPTSSRTAYRTYAEQVYFWNLYLRGQGALAARPGTSNHGWGTTVDVPTTLMAQLINQYGASYGWQKRWSDAPSEWWHFKYSSANDQHKGEKPKPKKKHPYHYMTKNEKHWRDVLRRERRIAKRHGGWDKVGDAHVAQAKRAKRELRKCLVRIQKRAKADGRGGWKKHHRWVRARYIRQLLYGKKK